MQLCILNSNVKRGLLENCSSSVTKLRPTHITSVGLIDYVKNDAIHKAGPVYRQFQYIKHKAGLVLCILKLAIHKAGEISL